MFTKLGLLFIPRQNKRVATVSNADVQSFFKVIDIRVVFPVKKGQKRQVVKFHSGSDGRLLGLCFDYITKPYQTVKAFFRFYAARISAT